VAESKRVETSLFRPFFKLLPGACESASVYDQTLASSFPFGLGFVDRVLMVPAVAADRLFRGK
jgi:hypothetical protein